MDADLLWKAAPLVTGIAGYIGGILSEPIKTSIKRKQEASQFKKGLYAELFRNLEVIEGTVLRVKQEKDYLSKYNPLPEHLSFECYAYCKKQPLTFNLFPEASVISGIYSLLDSLVTEKRSIDVLSAVVEQFHDTIIKLILNRSLDPFLLNAVDPERTRSLPLGRRLRLRLWKLFSVPFRKDPPLSLGRLSPKTETVRPLDALIAAKEQQLRETDNTIRALFKTLGPPGGLQPPKPKP